MFKTRPFPWRDDLNSSDRCLDFPSRRRSVAGPMVRRRSSGFMKFALFVKVQYPELDDFDQVRHPCASAILVLFQAGCTECDIGQLRHAIVFHRFGSESPNSIKQSSICFLISHDDPFAIRLPTFNNSERATAASRIGSNSHRIRSEPCLCPYLEHHPDCRSMPFSIGPTISAAAFDALSAIAKAGRRERDCDERACCEPRTRGRS